MKKPDIPENEAQRLTTLCALEVLDTPAEERFDRFTRIAKRHFGVSIALVSLVDSDRQWFKSHQGLDASETTRDISFCGHAILGSDIFYIPNALNDPLFVDNPLVTGPPNIRFYAGAPLRAPDGQRIGTLCIIDDKPREFSSYELTVLRDLADGVEAELERTRLLKNSHALQDSEERLRHLIQVSHGVIYACKASGDYGATYISAHSQDVLGYKPEDFIENPSFWLDHVHPDDREQMLKSLEKLFEQDEYSHEYRFLHADGRYRWMHDKLRLLRDDSGKPLEIIGLWTDITERKKTEQDLRESASRIRAIVDTVVDGIITIDANGTVQTINPAAEKIFGYAADEVMGCNVNILMPEPYSHEHDGYLHSYLSTGVKKVIGIGREVEGRRKDGSTFPMELAVSEMEVNNKRMFTGIVRDITERKQAEQDLRESASRIRAIVDTVVDGIITIDANGTVQTINPAAEKIFGYVADEVMGCNVNMLMPEPYSHEHDGYLHNYLTTGEKKVIGIGREVEGRRKDGSIFPMELAVSEMEVNNERMFTGIVRDITERKRLERMKSEFISTVSHELRTPLTSIRGALGLVLGKAADQLPDKARKMLEMAERNSERLTLLINDILDLEKIESGRMEFEFNSVDLVALARQAIADNDGYAKKHQVRLELVSTLGQAPVRGDEHRLLQVFANLISNAVKYSPRDGEVEITVTAHEDGYRIAIRDHGPGIPEQFREHIFQRFAQADSSDTREKGGTGLGLSITKAIVEHHKGHIEYESVPGKGTLFYFDLPVVQSSIVEGPEVANGVRVLICEDNPDVAAILAEMLQSEDVVSDVAGTADEARTLLDRYTYRLLLLDLTLPDVDGLQFLQELRATPATVDLPVIVVSGRAEEGRMAFKGDAVTVVDWLQKPIDQARLERALHEVLHGAGRPHILHVEDDPDIIQVTQVLLEDMADLSHVPGLNEARQRLAAQEFDLVILDLGLADGSGLDLLDELKGRCPVVIFSAQIPGREVSARVTAALTKSMTSNEQLLATIRKVLEG